MALSDNFSNSSALLVDQQHDYKYPRGLDLHPKSDKHGELLGWLTDYAQESWAHLSDKHVSWRAIDDVLQCYFLRPDWAGNTEKRGRRTDRNEHDEQFQIVMPVSYANLEMLLTYMSSAFWHHPVFRFDGVGPEDVLGALLMQHLIDVQMRQNKAMLALHTHWRDGFVYGIGAVAPYWKEKWGYRTELKRRGLFSRLRQVFIPTETERRRSEYKLLYEGNALDTIDPYALLPDPKVASPNIQDGEYLGWTLPTTVKTLLREEQTDDDLFNMRYLDVDGIYQSQYARLASRDRMTNPKGAADIMWMYVDLIPNDRGLGRSKYPEKWLFGVVGDQLIVHARPVGADHEMYQCAVCAPDYDGHSPVPLSRMEVVYDQQKLIDFLYTSHITNVRKAVNDMIIYDPWTLNSADMANPAPGKLIRTTRAMWGKGRVGDAYGQLQINDITRGHVADAQILQHHTAEALGTTDVARGQVQRTGARVSSSEIQGARQLVLARFERTARIIWEQSHSDIAEMFARNIQQRMSQETYIKVAGDLKNRLMQDFGYTDQQMQQNRVAIDPYDLVVNYDIIPHDGQIPGSQDANTWINLMQIAGQIPQAASMLKWDSLFKYVARLLRATNVDDFVHRTPTPTVMAEDQIEEQVRQGNAIPVTTPPA